MYQFSTQHHAYLIGSTLRDIRNDLIEAIEKVFDIQHAGNPDFLLLEYSSFGVDDARELRERAEVRPLKDKKVLIVGFSSTTAEAQNALLKLFEEPTPNTHFFLVTPIATQLLATLRSRLATLDEGRPAADTVLAKKFLRATAPERLVLLAPLIEEKDRDAIAALCNGLEELCAKMNDMRTLREVYAVRHYLRDRGASVKLLLEGLALITPTTTGAGKSA